MIQRIQSVFLAFTAILMIITLFLPLWQKKDPQNSRETYVTSFEVTQIQYTSEGLASDTVLYEKNIMYVAILSLLAVVASIFSIFQYRNRMRQIQLGALNSLLIGIPMFIVVWNSLDAEKLTQTEFSGTFTWAFYLMPFALILNSLANRFIRRDERLVRDSDRLR